MQDNQQYNDQDNFFRENLQSARQPPSPAVWQQIEKELDRKKRRIILLWWKATAAACLLAVSISFLWVTQKDSRSCKITTPGKDIVKANIASNPFKTTLPPLAATSMTKQKTTQLSSTSQPGFRLSSPAQAISMQMNPCQPNPVRSLSILANADLPSTPLSTATSYHHWSLYRPKPVPLSTPFRMNIQPPVTYVAKHFPTIIRSARKNPERRLDLTIYASQELLAYNFKDKDSNDAHGNEIEQKQNTSFSRCVGTFLSYKLTSHCTIQVGLNFSQSISSQQGGIAKADKDPGGKLAFRVNTATGFGYLSPTSPATIGDSTMTGRTTGKLDYFSIPLILSRNWTAGRFNLMAGAGLTADFLVHAFIKSSLLDQAGNLQPRNVDQYGLRKINCSWELKGECRYKLSSTLSATAMITFRTSVGPVNIHTPYNTYPYNLGLGLGITRTL